MCIGGSICPWYRNDIFMYDDNVGCPVLETLRNRNIGQPLPRQQAKDL